MRLYLGLLTACLVVTLPLEMLLGARVYRRPRRLVLTLLPVVVVFCAWDVLAIRAGHRKYDPRQTVGVLLPGRLPLEEEPAVLPRRAAVRTAHVRSGPPARRLAGGGRVTYTQTALLGLVGSVLVDVALLRTRLLGRRVLRVSYAIILAFQLLVNGVLTGREVVRYDEGAILGLRLAWGAGRAGPPVRLRAGAAHALSLGVARPPRAPVTGGLPATAQVQRPDRRRRPRQCCVGAGHGARQDLSLRHATVPPCIKAARRRRVGPAQGLRPARPRGLRGVWVARRATARRFRLGRPAPELVGPVRRGRRC